MDGLLEKLEKFKGLWKTKKALSLFLEDNDGEYWYNLLQTYWSNTWKKKGKVVWKDIADVVYSIYIRLLKSDNKGYCTCITTGQVLFWKDIQNGHYRTRSHLNTRYMDDNCYPQSYLGNIVKHGDYRNFCLKIREIHGEEKEHWLRNDNTQVKYRDSDYQEMIKGWHERILELKREKLLD